MDHEINAYETAARFLSRHLAACNLYGNERSNKVAQYWRLSLQGFGSPDHALVMRSALEPA
ncbi:hypothetical protein E4U39_004176 [Claviceps sp. Clav50 group G5]|nr:hypothetical protein E4U39_004176 [Claviceps sp. Clav50 group G5]